MKMEYRTEGTCSRRIFLELDGDTIRSVSFEGGCNGNMKGISSLVEGMNRDEAIQNAVHSCEFLFSSLFASGGRRKGLLR